METEGSLPRSQPNATCSRPQPDQFNPCPRSNSWRLILILFSHLCVGFPNGLFHSCFPTKTPCAPLLSPTRAYTPRLSYSSWFDRPNNIWWEGAQKLRTVE